MRSFWEVRRTLPQRVTPRGKELGCVIGVNQAHPSRAFIDTECAMILTAACMKSFQSCKSSEAHCHN